MRTMIAAETPTITIAQVHINPRIAMKCNEQWGGICYIDFTGRKRASPESEDQEQFLEIIQRKKELEEEAIMSQAAMANSKRPSRHLTGGSLMERPELKVTMDPIKTFSNCSGSLVSTPHEKPEIGDPTTTDASTSPTPNDGDGKNDAETKISKNPFMEFLRSSDDTVEIVIPKEGCADSTKHPLWSWMNSSLSRNDEMFVTRRLKRTPSQCSTRPVSPSDDVLQQPKSTISERKEYRSKSVRRSISACLARSKSTVCTDDLVPRPNSFIFPLPAHKLAIQSTQTSSEPTWLFSDRKCLQTTLAALRMTGWYYENCSFLDSIILLQDTEPGTFLVRDSADPNYLYSLSIQTCRGPTSVRLNFIDGRFRLDAEEKLIPSLPSFESVVELVEFYTAQCAKKRHKPKRKESISSREQVWVDSQGQIFSNILLKRPLRKVGKVNSLMHSCRLTICRSLRKHIRSDKDNNKLVTDLSVSVAKLTDSLGIPPNLSVYLKDYPYSH